MSKVITFSTRFPSYHIRSGEETLFKQSILLGLIDRGNTNFPYSKHHTIRSGNRWKVGDKFSPRVWGDDINPNSGRSGAYHSKQITIAPDLEIKNIWDFEITENGIIKYANIKINLSIASISKLQTLTNLANNDGLSLLDFYYWFKIDKFKSGKAIPFKGQIICWNENIQY